MSEEIHASKIIVGDFNEDSDDGPVTIIEPGRIRLEGPGRGWVIFGIDADHGASGMLLVSRDGKRKTKLFADTDEAGMSIKEGDQETTVAAGGFLISGSQHVTLSHSGLMVKDANDETVLALPFSVDRARRFVQEFASAVLGQVKAWLSGKSNQTAA